MQKYQILKSVGGVSGDKTASEFTMSTLAPDFSAIIYFMPPDSTWKKTDGDDTESHPHVHSREW